MPGSNEEKTSSERSSRRRSRKQSPAAAERRSTRRDCTRSRSIIRGQTPQIGDDQPSTRRERSHSRSVVARRSRSRERACLRASSSRRRQEQRVRSRSPYPRVPSKERHQRPRDRHHQVSRSRSISPVLPNSRHQAANNLFSAQLFEKMLDVMANYENRSSRKHEAFPAMNVIPDFDPMSKEQSVDAWVHKVEECAQIYDWSDKQTVHYALPKLCGVAKTWYQGLPSVLYSWSEWKAKLLESFPSRENYAELLTEMLSKKVKFGEPLEVYYYSKLNLLNRCSIFGKKAVDCIIFGIEDRGIRLSAQAAQFSEPEELLKFFKNVKVGQTKDLDGKNRDTKKISYQSQGSSETAKSTKSDANVKCFNCNELGHTFYKCPKPVIKCTLCKWRGHTMDKCPKQVNNNLKVNNNSNSVMEVRLSDDIHTKYRLPVKVNGSTLTAHIDLGSDCTLMRLNDAKNLDVKWQRVDSPVLKGLGNVPYRPIGLARLKIDVQGVVENDVEVLIVDDHMISCPILIGHSYTERPSITITKTPSDLIIKRCENQYEACKLPLMSTTDVHLLIDGLSAVNVQTNISYTGSIYVHGTVRGSPGKESFLLPGEYELLNGAGTLLVQNLSSNNFTMPANSLVTRAQIVTKADNERFCSILEVNAVDESALRCGDLSAEQNDKLRALLHKYKDCFSSHLQDLGFTSASEMVIHLKDSEPVVYRPYRLSLSDKQLVQNMIQEMLDCDIIRESSSPYASPIVLVQKKTGEKRLCVDYRALNNKTVKEHFPLPRIEDQLDLLAHSKLFISLDLASGYYQIPIVEESRHKTAFVTPDGQYEFNRMPFGLVNAPSVFQRAVNKILNKARVKYALVYMDDVLIPAKDFEEGLTRLEEVLSLLREGGLTLKLNKCKFFLNKIDYLGFEISAEGIRPGSLKTEAVSKFPVPKNQHDIRRFIGLASFFRRFIKDFAITARPLTSLLKQNAVWCWSNEQQQAFDALKQKLIERPVLALYDPKAETQLHTDASKMGIAGILLQKNEAGVFQPIAYYSRQTNSDEQKLHSYELETLAVIASLNRFRVYLLGIPFIICTDCNALRTTLTKRDLVPRIARWWIQFQEFDCSIEHRPGEKMQHVDALSRNAIPESTCENRALDILVVNSEDWIATVQENDDNIKHIKRVLSDPKSEKNMDIIKNYKLKNGRVYRIIGSDTLRWVVPKSVRWQILQANHDNVGHFGFDKTLDRICSSYWFPKMRRFVKKYVSSCMQCAHHKMPSGAKAGLLHPIPKVDVPFHTVHADHLGPFNKSKRRNTYILVIVDAFTKFVNLTAVPNTKSSTSVKVFKEHFSYFGTPTRLITDQGTSFTGKTFQDFIKTNGIKHIFNAVSTPRANGQVERYNRTILAALGAMTHDKPKNIWDDYLPDIQLGINTSVHSTTKKTPTELLFGRRVTNPSEGILNDVINDLGNGIIDTSLDETRREAKRLIDSQQAKDKKQYDARKRVQKFNEGDLVRALRAIPSQDGQSRKLEPKFRGPYRIKKVLPNDRYIIEDTALTRKGRRYEGIVAVDKIHPWLSFGGTGDDSDNSCDSKSDEGENID